jgi:hypothetical protein
LIGRELKHIPLGTAPCLLGKRRISSKPKRKYRFKIKRKEKKRSLRRKR